MAHQADFLDFPGVECCIACGANDVPNGPWQYVDVAVPATDQPLIFCRGCWVVQLQANDVVPRASLVAMVAERDIAQSADAGRLQTIRDLTGRVETFEKELAAAVAAKTVAEGQLFAYEQRVKELEQEPALLRARALRAGFAAPATKPDGPAQKPPTRTPAAKAAA